MTFAEKIVAAVQARMAGLGFYRLHIDGLAGAGTLGAWDAFLAENRLRDAPMPTAMAHLWSDEVRSAPKPEPASAIPAGFKGAAKRIDDEDLPRIGAQIEVGEDEIHAVLDVEAAGSGFDGQGRPKMLFEPHIFYRHLSGRERDRAVAEGLARKSWKRDYPKDSYPRLARAMEINETAALKSASWGLGQVMGFNHEMLGYETVQAMVAAFCEDEEAHLQGMVDFIVAAGLDDDLRRHDWRGFARGYNGPSYAVHNYHGRLADRYEWWSRIPDTPYTRPAAA